MSDSKEQRPVPPELGHSHSGHRRPYERPRLIEWGSLVELTRGPELSGLQDLPMDGGSENQ